MSISCHLSKSFLKCWWLQGNPCWNSITVYPVTLTLVPLTIRPCGYPPQPKWSHPRGKHLCCPMKQCIASSLRILLNGEESDLLTCMLLSVFIAGSWDCRPWWSLWRYPSWSLLCLPGAGSLVTMFFTVFFFFF